MAQLLFFKEINEFTSYLTGDHSLSLNSIRPAIISVQNRYIKDIVGYELMTSLLTKVNANVIDLNPKEEETVDLIRSAIASLTMATATPKLNVKASNGGFTVGAGERNNIASSFRVNDYRDSSYAEGQQQLDELYIFLEKNVEVTALALYKNSDERKLQKTNILNTSEEMRKYLVPAPGRFVFKQMKPCIERAEEKFILPTIGVEMYSTIKDIIRNGESTVDYDVIIDKIRRVVAHYAFADAIRELSIKIDPTYGVYVSFYKNANEPMQSSPQSLEESSHPISINEKHGSEALGALQKELIDNLEAYPLFEASEAYTAPKENYYKNEDPGIFLNIGI